MATALVRDLDDAVYERLKARAAGNNRSLEAELREILELASKQVDMATARAAADEMRAAGGSTPQRQRGDPGPGTRPVTEMQMLIPRRSRASNPAADRESWCPTPAWA